MNTTPEETWKPFPPAPCYEASSEGRVRRIGGAVLKTRQTRNAYPCLSIFKRTLYVHRMVCWAFHGEPEGRQVNHINGDKTDARAVNLEWVTASENMRHSSHVLGNKSHLIGKFSGRHPTSRAVIAMDMATGVETYYESGMDAARAGFSHDGVNACCHGRQNTHAGRRWRFAP